MTNYFNQICEFRQSNPISKGNPIKTDNPILNDVKNALNNLKNELEKKYSQFEGINFKIEVSKGAANFPNVVHVCILPPNQKVSDGIYVGICFDISGKGAVIGCMESKTKPKGLNTLIRKKGKTIPELDVDGSNASTKYNNAYENPKDFYYNLVVDAELENQISKSLSLCLYNLGKIKNSKYLQTNDYLNSTINEREIEYFNIDEVKDERKKVASEIYVRRGQKTFRNELLDTYKRKCAVTECEIEQMLEAAHIYGFKGAATDKIPNGILLRSDIHTLFDLGLITINPDNYSIRVSAKIITDEYYFKLNNKKINLPKRTEDYPDKNSLKYHFENIFNN